MSWDPTPDRDSPEHLLLGRYRQLVHELNRRVNLFARPAMGASFHERHIVHALCLRVRRFQAGSTVVDWGSGGGIPGIPLAICFPEVRFILVEANTKKAAALRLVQSELRLPNVEVWNGRAEEWSGRQEYAVSRATAPLADLWIWTQPGLVAGASPIDRGEWQRGLICLKGGDLTVELRRLRASGRHIEATRVDLFELTGKEAFREKYIVHVVPGTGEPWRPEEPVEA